MTPLKEEVKREWRRLRTIEELVRVVLELEDLNPKTRPTLVELDAWARLRKLLDTEPPTGSDSQ